MRAYVVSVDYTDLLRLTLPYNRKHFDQVIIVTSPKDTPDIFSLASQYKADVVVTDLFYANGAIFNKWAALEYAMDVAGRDGWTVLLDADIVWPKVTDLERYLRPGYLYCPRRLMCDPAPLEIPSEERWQRIYPLHPQVREFAGYSQIFHGSDPVLGPPPWHQTDWTHAGGADTFFQSKWPEDRKVRPPFKVLHLGPAGVNWCGRASRYVGGGQPAEAEVRRYQVREMMRRRDWRAPDPFAHERLPS